MTISISFAIDFFIFAFLVLFIYRGVRRGLFITFFTMLAVLVAMGAGWFLSSHYADALAISLQPGIEEKITSYITTNNVVSDSAALAGMGYSQAFSNAIQSTLASETGSSMGSSIATIAARSVMFLIGFAVVMAVWELLSHFLGLVTRFPVLHMVDRILGGVMGFFLGYVFLLLLHWVLCDLLCCVPQDILEGSHLAPLLISGPLFSLVGA